MWLIFAPLNGQKKRRACIRNGPVFNDSRKTSFGDAMRPAFIDPMVDEHCNDLTFLASVGTFGPPI